MARTPEAEFVTIARIRKSHGRRGEVAAEILTDFPDRFRPGAELWVAGRDTPRCLVLEGSWFHKGRVILKFRGVDSISAAETLAGLPVQIPRAERHALPPRAVYVSDLMGCTVLAEGENLGKVVAWEETGAVPLLRVEAAEGEILVPFAQEICGAVDLEKKEIRVRLPEGLRELNRSPDSPRGRYQRRKMRAGGPRRPQKPPQKR